MAQGLQEENGRRCFGLASSDVWVSGETN